jgi:hypothetical protein
MFRFDQGRNFVKHIMVRMMDGDTLSGAKGDKNSASDMTKSVADLEGDAAVARRMIIGLLCVGIALFITASFNGKELPFFMKTVAAVLIVISIWFFWTAPNRFNGQSRNQRSPETAPISLRAIMACMQTLVAVATGALIWLL